MYLRPLSCCTCSARASSEREREGTPRGEEQQSRLQAYRQAAREKREYIYIHDEILRVQVYNHVRDVREPRARGVRAGHRPRVVAVALEILVPGDEPLLLLLLHVLLFFSRIFFFTTANEEWWDSLGWCSTEGRLWG